jgi:hypothetical protein
MRLLRARTVVVALASLAVVAGGVTACSNSDQGKAEPDKGVMTATPVNMDEEGLSRALTTAAKPEDGWISAPWILATKTTEKSTEIQIKYIAGDTVCTGPAGFTLEEDSSKVTIGAYVKKVDRDDAAAKATPCPTNINAERGEEWGSIKLAEPLGSRELIHAGLDKSFDGFKWDVNEGVQKPAEPPASESPKSEEPKK